MHNRSRVEIHRHTIISKNSNTTPQRSKLTKSQAFSKNLVVKPSGLAKESHFIDLTDALTSSKEGELERVKLSSKIVM